MGLTQSTNNNNNTKTKYSDEDIKKNINQLFLNNKTDYINETSLHSLGNLESQKKIQTGGTKKRNRYEKYDIKHYLQNIAQNGGEVNPSSDKYKEISDLSEFKKLKNYLQNNLNQNGGTDKINVQGMDDLLNEPSPDTLTERNNKNDLLLKLIKGGTKRTTEEEDISEDEDVEFDNINRKRKQQTCPSTSDKTDIKENVEILKRVGVLNDDEEEEFEKAGGEKKKKEEEEFEEEEKINSYSETSYNSASSEMNVLPFYSSSSSSDYSFKHPFVKNRFN